MSRIKSIVGVVTAILILHLSDNRGRKSLIINVYVYNIYIIYIYIYIVKEKNIYYIFDKKYNVADYIHLKRQSVQIVLFKCSQW